MPEKTHNTDVTRYTSSNFGLVDLFAGPGGLAEGFSAVKDSAGNHPFQIALSVEKERSAHSTLLLRTFLRQFSNGYPDAYYDFLNNDQPEPDWSRLFPNEWRAATEEALCLELGAPGTDKIVQARIDAILGEFGKNTVVIGGPPCQAYSLVGRARNRGIQGYVSEEDNRHFLYKEYIQILKNLRPAAFVMENVKGILSSTVGGERIFDHVMSDLRNAAGSDSYELLAMAPPGHASNPKFLEFSSPEDYIVRAEDFGLPQARHRVIVVGVRHDLMDRVSGDSLLNGRLTPSKAEVCVHDVLDGLPRLRSGLSRGNDSSEEWERTIRIVIREMLDNQPNLPSVNAKSYQAELAKMAASVSTAANLPRRAIGPVGISAHCPRNLRSWLIDEKLKGIPNHEARGHMPPDLARYLFAALYGEVMHRSPKATDFPGFLAPDHRNWNSGKFTDRFRVQLWTGPSTTVTSHISKDGNYFIHPDPAQCRSLTVREAARLQTFPDNYLFKGNRTEQFVQVGNAVPPFLAKQIGETLFGILSGS